MKRELRKELTRIKHEIEKCEVDYGDIKLAEWAGITEEDWNNGKLNESEV